MTGGEVTCIGSIEGAEVFGQEIKHVSKLAVLNVTCSHSAILHIQAGYCTKLACPVTNQT